MLPIKAALTGAFVLLLCAAVCLPKVLSRVQARGRPRPTGPAIVFGRTYSKRLSFRRQSTIIRSLPFLFVREKNGKSPPDDVRQNGLS